MIIYNVTVKTDWSIHEAWLHWMLNEHIPEMLATQLFHDYKMMRLINADDTEGPTYAIQYHTHNLADYQQYVTGHAASMQARGHSKWGNKTIAFRSLLETVN